MNAFLGSGMENLADMLQKSSNTKVAFKSITDVIQSFSKLISEEVGNRSMWSRLFRKDLVSELNEFQLTLCN